jgi:AcrR family transcriptional regulator
MALTASQPAFRPKRADAIRNRELIFAAAKHCFAERGAAATMEDIARRAEVGVGSLYRAFGNRAGLAEAIFCDMIEQLAQAAATSADAEDPWQELVSWIDDCIDRLIEKHTMLADLRPLFEHDRALLERSHQVGTQSVSSLLQRARANGAIRNDVNAADFFRLILGIVPAGGGDRVRAKSLQGILLAGIKSR